MGVTAEYPAILGLYPHNSGYVAAWLRGYATKWIRGYVATWLSGWVATWLHGYAATWLGLGLAIPT